jgi:hypothetical protein
MFADGERSQLFLTHLTNHRNRFVHAGSDTDERYEALTGHPAPVMGGHIDDRQADRDAREQISHELGHDRIEVVAEYIGGRGT